jgi:hypothetical protein|nr:MAG TPA_asm: hypothetical protein [Caudoviricetes sp.]
MKTLDEIMHGLECCMVAGNSDTCDDCPYFTGTGSLLCVGELAQDAIAYEEQFAPKSKAFRYTVKALIDAIPVPVDIALRIAELEAEWRTKQ